VSTTTCGRVDGYLALRRSLGFSLATEGGMLRDFAERLDAAGQGTVTVAAALAWANLPAEASAAHRRRRLGAVRGFARYLAAYDPACEVPPAGLLSARSHRPDPYIYSPAEIAALVHAAGTLAAPLHAATARAVVSLTAACGLRTGEAVGLDHTDVDLGAGELTVTGKGRTRRLPLHPTTVAMLADYTARRDRLRPAAARTSPAFFVTTTGHRVGGRVLQSTFGRLVVLAGITTPPGRRRPRVHDLRHTFTVTTLVNWYRSGVDVQAHLPILSAFLGHTCPEHTYWYLQATPELLALAAERLEPPTAPAETPPARHAGR
jgi:integrase